MVEPTEDNFLELTSHRIRPAPPAARRALRAVGIVGLIGLEREIAETLRCPVDVVPAANVKAGLAPQVLAEAIPL